MISSMRFVQQGVGRWLTLAIAVVVCFGARSASPESRQYDIDPQHFSAGFLVTHLGFAKVYGMFREAEGRFTFDEDSGAVSDVRVVVKTASVFTAVEDRDRHLKSADFLDVEEHPEIVFESSGTRLVDRKATIQGDLTILGVTKPITLDVTWNKSGVSPLAGNPYVAGFSVRGSFLRSEFGMTYGLADVLVGDEVQLVLELEAQRQ